MKFSDILGKAIEIICDDEIALDTDSKKRTKLISCGNMVYQELVEQFVPLKNNELLEFADGILMYANFAKPIKDILYIKKNGTSHNFSMYPSYVSCPIKGIAEVGYIYHAEEVGIDDDIVLPPQFNENILALGISSEYFYRSGLCDEAIFYKNRYDNAVINLTRKRASIHIKGCGLL
ncbi:MAG: hypothetical protein WCR54_04005 [Clostridia bacterium]